MPDLVHAVDNRVCESDQYPILIELHLRVRDEVENEKMSWEGDSAKRTCVPRFTHPVGHDRDIVQQQLSSSQKYLDDVAQPLKVLAVVL